MPYKKDTVYNFHVKSLEVDPNTGKEYAAVYDPADENHLYRIYNLFNGQLYDLPAVLPVKVKKIDEAMGRIFFCQDEASTLRLQYEEGETYEFQICDEKTDYNSKAPYYVVEDDFAEHRYYPDSESDKTLGDIIKLQVQSIDDRGFLSLRNPSDGKRAARMVPRQPSVTPVAAAGANYPIFDGGDEGTTLEYKTSIVFPPGNDGTPDVDKQLFTIIKEIAAFLNSEGGSIFVGIRDQTKEIVGIADDFAHLNEGEDKYNGSYKGNVDSYQLKIRNAVDRFCNGLANNLIDFHFHDQGGRTYCEIKVTPSPRPIWVKGNILLTRTGNRMKTLYGEDITTFVYRKSSVGIKEILDTEDLASISSEAIADALKDSYRRIVQERRKQMAAPISEPPTAPPKFYIVWYNDGTWRWQRAKSNDGNVFFQQPVYDVSGFVVFCYASGTVNKVSINVFRRDGRAKQLCINALGTRGFNPNEKPLAIYVALPSDLISVYSTDCDGSEHIKVHRLTDFNDTARSTNQGPRIIPQGNRAVAYKLIFASDQRKVKNLIVSPKDTTSNPGFVVDSLRLADQIGFILGECETEE